MKLIFLDIDGVLNSWEQRRTAHFLPECMARLNQIIFATGAVVVLSSSWRSLIHQGHLTIYGFNLLLRTHGFHGELTGLTRPERDSGAWELTSEARAFQIADYLKENKHHSYCILDDDPRAFGGRPGVQTDGNGLSDADVKLAIEILGAKEPCRT